MSLDQTQTVLDADIEPALQRTPTVLALDTSGSMRHKTETPTGETKPKIEQLNRGLDVFDEEMAALEHASKRVDVAVVTFGGSATVEQEFTPVSKWSPPTLSAGNSTPMAAAVEQAIDLVADRLDTYLAEGIACNRPFIWLLTDGKPTDMKEDNDRWKAVQKQLREGVDNNDFEFFALGVRGAEMETLNALVEAPTGKPAVELQEGMFEELFAFISKSMENVSNPSSSEGGEMDVDHLQQFARWGQVD